MEQQAEWFGMQMLGQEVCRIGVANSVGEPIAAWEAYQGTPIGGMPFARTRSYQDRVQEDDKEDNGTDDPTQLLDHENEDHETDDPKQLLKELKLVTQELRERVRELEEQQKLRGERDSSGCCTFF